MLDLSFIHNGCVGGGDFNRCDFFFLFHFSASMGHINTIGSVDRSSPCLKVVGSEGVAIGEVACRSMASLNRLAPYGGEAPPPYEWTLSLSVEEVVSVCGVGQSRSEWLHTAKQ